MVVSQRVDKNRIAACRKAIHHWLGREGGMVRGGTQEGFLKPSGDLSNHKSVRGLLASPQLCEVLDYLFGGIDRVDLSNQSGQVALRFPENVSPPFSSSSLSTSTPEQWHTDGHRQGRMHPFSCLLGVCLQDITEPWSGNLWVWPKSHRAIHPFVTQPHGFIDMDALAAAGPLREPVQLTLRMGDVIILHPDTAHTGGPNLGSEIRYMVYSRIKHKHAVRSGGCGEGGPRPISSLSWEEISARHRDDMYFDLPGVQAGRGVHQEA